MLTREELLFLKRAEGLSRLFEKVGEAKRLIAEAQAEMAQFAHKTKAKAKTKSKAKKIEYGVDLPDEMTNAERSVFAELQKAGVDGRAPCDLIATLKLSPNTVWRATKTLKKRKLVTSVGVASNRIWKVK